MKDRQNQSSSNVSVTDVHDLEVEGNRPASTPSQPGMETDWLPRLFELAGVPPDADLKTVQARMDDLANRAAPTTRVWWNWILFLEGLAICAPLGWLIQRSLGLPLEVIAAATLFTALILLAVSWWLRWRSMQKTWAHARLVTEAARSLLATAGCPRSPAWRSLTTIESLGPLRSIANSSRHGQPLVEWRNSYIKNRIEDQEKYFSYKQKEAESQRKQLSRWATILLDIALAFASAGAVLAIAPRGREWMGMLGDVRLEIVLGIVGALAPLGLLLVQMLRGVHDLNRRTARFAQQRQMLQEVKARLTSAASDDAAMEVIDDTEHQLLGEVLEWYFQAETVEHFFRTRPAQDYLRSVRKPVRTHQSFVTRLSFKILGATGLAGLFLLRVILGRLPWVIGSAAAAWMWLAYYNPTQHKNDLGSDTTLATLRDAGGEDWKPDSGRSEHGCIIFVHGLYGAVSPADPAKAWTKRCADAIDARMGRDAPNICLVDWKNAAQPALFNRLSLGLGKQADFIGDIASIRPQAQEVGRLLAHRISEMIVEEKTIRSDRPFHLVGHSAGGFVVARVAVLLKKLGIAPQHFHVTILDTPAPDREILVDLPTLYSKDTVDFYVTSELGGRGPDLKFADFSARNIHMKRLSAPKQNGLSWWNTQWDAHRWACTWFKETIANPDSAPGEGFNRSPFAKTAPEGDR